MEGRKASQAQRVCRVCRPTALLCARRMLVGHDDHNHDVDDKHSSNNDDDDDDEKANCAVLGKDVNIFIHEVVECMVQVLSP